MPFPARPLWERFWPKVDASGDCWLWTGAQDRGYGLVWVNERIRAARAHRVSYELLVGPIPEGMTVDHLCRVTLCVNPDHMDFCGKGQNAARSPNAPYWRKKRQTHCKRGHEFTPENTRPIRNGTGRSCRECSRLHYQASKKAQA